MQKAKCKRQQHPYPPPCTLHCSLCTFSFLPESGVIAHSSYSLPAGSFLHRVTGGTAFRTAAPPRALNLNPKATPARAPPVRAGKRARGPPGTEHYHGSQCLRPREDAAVTGPPTNLLDRLRRLAAPPAATAADDAALLDRFVRARDEAAFAAVV